MMQGLRENTKIIMIFVALSFIGLMVFEWGMDVTGRTSSAQGELGRVNGEAIPYQAYSAAYQQLYDQARQQSGGQLSREQTRQVEDAAFNEVVNQLLIQQELKRRGIGVSDAEIRQAALLSPHPDLMNNEIFQTDGRFDLKKYQQFLASPSANEELLLQLEQYYRTAIPRNKLMQQVTAGMYVSEAELWQLFRDRSEQATVDYVALPVSKLVPGEVSVGDAEVKAYYEAHKDEFKRPATARLTLAVLSKAPTAADSAAALQKAQAVRQEIAGGADFAQVAARESADPGSKDNGGSLGTFGRGQMVPAFDQAAFSLPVGQLSEPVQTPFGYHLIEVTAREGDQVTARHILIPIAPSEEALDALAARADSLEQLGERGGLARAARALHAAVRQGVEVAEDQAFVPGVGSVLEGVEWARDETQNPEAGSSANKVSPAFETEQAFYVAQLEGYTPAGTMPLSQASAQIRRQLTVEKKTEAAKKIGQQMVAEARGGKTLEQVAAAHGLQVETAGPFTRMDVNPVFGQANAAIGASFGVPIGKVSDVVQTSGGLFIIRPKERTAADRQAFEAQKAQLRQVLLYQLQQQQVARWMEELRRESKIVDNRAEVLRRSA